MQSEKRDIKDVRAKLVYLCKLTTWIGNIFSINNEHI